MRKIALVVLSSVLGVAASAAAQTTSSATPDTAARPSTLHFDIDGLAPPVGGRLPRALQVNAPPGFRVNLKAVAQRCSKESAELNECPARSKLGQGSLVVSVTAPDGVRTVTIPLTVYLHSSTGILAVAKIFGWQVVPGTLSTHSGFIVSFDPLPAGPPFPGVSYMLKRITLGLGATRVVRSRVKTKLGTRVRTHRLVLFGNPFSCRGGWASSVSLTFGDGSVTRLAVPMPCAKS